MNSDIPDYINKFIQFNSATLKDIFEAGCDAHHEGFLMFECDQSTNDVQVYFVSKQQFDNMGKLDFYNDIKNNISEDQKDDMVLYIMDKAINKPFLLIIKKS